MRPFTSPIIRITAALIGITLALVLCAHAFRILPDEREEALAHRKRSVEALTVQLSSPVMMQDGDAMAEVLDAVVARNPDVLSAALRDAEGAILIESGDHTRYWQHVPGGRSTPEFVRAPIYVSGSERAALEVRFSPLPSPWSLSLSGGIVALLLFLGLGGAFGYFIVLRRSLKALDPSAVIPERVRLALDTLVEGVIIVDEQQNMLLVNRAFAADLGVPVEELLGRKADALNWRAADTGGAVAELPWAMAMAKRAPVTDQAIELRTADGAVRCFSVNATPVLDPKGRVRGALASFDDVTDLHHKNEQLQRTLAALEESRKAIEKHNIELRYLATRDPLTGCLNRRAFFDGLEPAFASARMHGDPLCCAMIDIDHFKRINDKFGHATGDRVIAFVAETIRMNVRSSDLVGRYGGEEFCVMLPALSSDEVAVMMERIREAVTRGAAARFTRSLTLTVSCGIAQQRPDDRQSSAMLERADVALYTAKNSGRDRVELWRPGLEGDLGSQTSRHRRPTGELTGIWKGPDRVAKHETGLHRTINAGAMDAFREQVTQTLALAARHSWSAALLRIEFETVGIAVSKVAVEMVERVAGLLRRSDTLSLIVPEHAAVGGPELLPNVSPLGPTEVGVLLPDVSDLNAIGRVVQRIVKSVSEPVVVDGERAFVKCLIGISVAPADGEDFDTLMHCAEQARRVTRDARGGERYAFYQPSMTETLMRSMRIESGLRHALERDELELYYQPQVKLGSGRVCGYEALLRWTDPDGHAVSPDQFIPIAETSGLIGAIGDWVLHTACVQAREWQRARGASLRVAVNVSAVQVMSAGFADRVAAILKATEVDPRLIELEITETAFMSDLAASAATLQQLRRLGVHIALDDFGTGYSSLSYLKQLPIDSVKIDSRFIRDLNESGEGVMLVTAILGMAHGLGIRVVAEGVETLETLALLERLGCDEVQGYVIARPLPAAESFAMSESDPEADAPADGRVAEGAASTDESTEAAKPAARRVASG